MNEYETDFMPNFSIDDEIIVDDYDENVYFVALVNDKIVAFAEALLEEDYYERSNTLIVCSLYVSEKYQRYGIGSLLIQKLKEYAVENNVEYLFASVIPGNENARSFFKKNNFAEDGKESFAMRTSNTDKQIKGEIPLLYLQENLEKFVDEYDIKKSKGYQKQKKKN